jgi:hypothetical protein
VQFRRRDQIHFGGIAARVFEAMHARGTFGVEAGGTPVRSAGANVGEFEGDARKGFD